jgi:hypothetical protein
VFVGILRSRIVTLLSWLNALHHSLLAKAERGVRTCEHRCVGATVKKASKALKAFQNINPLGFKPTQWEVLKT